MHQEIFGQMSKSLVTLWCPLTNVSKYNGTLNLIPGSHKDGVLKHTFYKVNGKNIMVFKKNFLMKKKLYH